MRAAFIAALTGLILVGCAPQLPPETTAAAPAPTRFVCDGGKSLSVAFAADVAMLDAGRGAVRLEQQRVASGFAYAGEGYAIRGKDHELTFTAPDGASGKCREQGWAMRQPQVQPVVMPLVGSAWTLVSFNSSDDGIGKVMPPNPTRYTMTFEPGGQLTMQLDCNRARGTWQTSDPVNRGGAITIKGGPMTRAACPAGSMDTQIARDLSQIRSYTIAGNRLFLALEADSGVYEFRVE